MHACGTHYIEEISFTHVQTTTIPVYGYYVFRVFWEHLVPEQFLRDNIPVVCSRP